MFNMPAKIFYVAKEHLCTEIEARTPELHRVEYVHLTKSLVGFTFLCGMFCPVAAEDFKKMQHLVLRYFTKAFVVQVIFEIQRPTKEQEIYMHIHKEKILVSICAIIVPNECLSSTAYIHLYFI